MTCKARLLQAGFLVVALAVGASRALAAPLFGLELAFGDVQLISGTPISDTVAFHSGFEGTNFFSRSAFGSAQAGLLRSSSTASIQLTPVVTLGLGSVLNGTDSSAAFRLDDVIISGPGTSVSTALNMHVSGGLAATTFAQLNSGVGAESIASASVTVGASVGGNIFTGTRSVGSTWQVETQSGGGSTFEDGLLTGFSGDGTVVTPTMVLPVGTPFVLTLSLATSVDTNTANAILGSRRQAEASSLFDSTLSFALSGPVFDLPTGFTANSVSGLIVDNRWLGLGDSGTGSGSVPEPSSLLLFITSLLFLARRFSRQAALL